MPNITARRPQRNLSGIAMVQHKEHFPKFARLHVLERRIGVMRSSCLIGASA